MKAPTMKTLLLNSWRFILSRDLCVDNISRTNLECRARPESCRAVELECTYFVLNEIAVDNLMLRQFFLVLDQSRAELQIILVIFKSIFEVYILLY